MMKEMHIAERTVKAHLNRLYLKFDIDSRYVKRVRLIYLIDKRRRRKLWDEEDRKA